MTTNTKILLGNGRVAAHSLYEEVRLQVEEIIPALEDKKRYTLEMLCGPDFWNSLDEGSQRTAGICMADMVRQGVLPLVEAEPKHEYSRWYQLK